MRFPDPDECVRALLAVAGLQPSEEEIRAAVKGYRALRSALQRLHDFPIDHEEETALGFRLTADLDAQTRRRPAESWPTSSATDAATSRS
ncbi:hypothetical protein GCM10011608_44860 [Micromonospora sonchi]|uniref:Uncharacterized protein n=1 Tax=Micromonospora sonchi TaxID=1763543 RepID=A0A917U4Q5_9ACTN|nr:hypothetical protein GCM10011608_44860 [Micromonospora sonchi]